MKTEQKTIIAMIKIFCEYHHKTHGSLCEECNKLQEYAFYRLKKCPYAKNKPTCSRCPIHCYDKNKRDEIRKVMRFAGPRMLYKHPILALKHSLQDKKNGHKNARFILN